MNRISASLCFGLLLAAGAHAQTTISAASVSGFSGETIDLPLTVSGFSAVAGVELHLTDNGAGFTPQAVSSAVLDGMTIGVFDDQVNLIWEDFMDPLTLADGDTLAVVSYLLEGSAGDSTPIVFSNCEMANEMGDVIAAEYMDGSLSIQVPQPPSAFNLLSPADESIVSQSTQTLAWEASVNDNPGTQLYTVYLSMNEDLSSSTTWSDLEDTGFTLPDLEDNTTYYWSVLAQDVDTEGTMANQIWSFETLIPDCPYLEEAFETQMGNEDEDLIVNALLQHYDDEDGDELMLIGLSDNLEDLDFSWQMNEGNLILTPPEDWHGEVTFELTVSDGGCSTVDAMSASFAAVNDAPVVPEIADAEIEEDTQFNTMWEPMDVDQDLLEVSLQSDTAELTAVYTEDISRLIVTPEANWSGVGNITVHVYDGTISVSTSFELTVNAVNDAPEVILSTGPNSACGVVTELGHYPDATSGFIVDLNNEEISLEIQDPDDATVTIRGYINDSQMLELQYDTNTIAVINGLDLSDYYDSDIVLYFSVDDGEAVWNENGVECQWTLNFLALPAELPLEFYLAPSAPNPFNPSTRIAFGLPFSTEVELGVYNLQGQKIDELVHGTLPAGEHQLQWQAGNLASGCYLLVMQTSDFHQVQRLLLVR